MTSDGPLYYNAAQLAEAAGVSIRRVYQQVSANTGGLASAKEVVPGIGTVYRASKCAKFLALMAASTGRRSA